LFIITPKLIEEAKRRNLEKIVKSGHGFPEQQQEGSNYHYRLESEPYPPHVKERILKEIRKLDKMTP
jgi:hypothetical protein